MKSILFCGFSSIKPNGQKLLKKFDHNYYLNNYYESLKQQGCPQVAIQLDGRTVNLVGIPLVADSEEIYKTTLDDIQEIHQNYANRGSHFLVQIDPTPYLYNLRFIRQKFFAKTMPNSIEEHLLKDTPTFPIDVSELILDYKLFDLMHVLKSAQGREITKDEKTLIEEILNDKNTGYFTKFLSHEKIVQNEPVDPEFQQHFTSMQQQLLHYEFDESPRINKAYFSLCLLLSMLSGPTYVGDVPKIFLRMSAGFKLQLDELKDTFKEFVAIKLEYPDDLAYISVDAADIGWKQTLKDLYLLFTINQILDKQKDLQELTVYCENSHINSLKEALNAQKGILIEETDSSYFEQFKYKKARSKSTDEELIEKHAILDLIDEHPIWKESFIRNPFPYISQPYHDLTPEDKKEVQKTFFKYNSQYKRVLEKLNNK